MPQTYTTSQAFKEFIASPTESSAIEFPDVPTMLQITPQENLMNVPKGSTVYTGVPISADFTKVDLPEKLQYKESIGLSDCGLVIAVVGGSQGGGQLNEDVVAIIGRLMQFHRDLGVVHIVGPAHEQAIQQGYNKELLSDERKRVIIKTFVPDVYRYTGAADVIVSRASATVIAELAVQGKAVVLVPGKLSDDHQTVNARHLIENGRALQVPFGDREGLYNAVNGLLTDTPRRERFAASLHEIAKPKAASDLAILLMHEFGLRQ